MYKLSKAYLLIISILLSFEVNAYYGNFYVPSAEEIQQYLEARELEQREAHAAYLKEWTVEYEPHINILHGDIATPIKTGGTYHATHPSQGTFAWDSETRIAESVIVVTLQDLIHQSGYTMDYRPTLYITIPGQASGAPIGSGSGTKSWQAKVEKKLKAEYANREELYKHFVVDWHSMLTNGRQVKQLAKVVHSFLSGSSHDWDVVIIGHSRGGILAHELTGKLNSSKIVNVYTYLVDPTAKISAADYFPIRKHSIPGAESHRAFNYYDNEPFIDDAGGIASGLVTTSDENIDGYHNRYIPNTDHNGIITDLFVNSSIDDFGMDYVFSQLFANKPLEDDQYQVEMPSGSQAVVLSQRELDIDFNLGADGGNLYGSVHISMGPLTSGHMISVGEDGLHLQAGMILASAQFILAKDQVAVSNSTMLADISASLSSDGLHASVESLGMIETGVSLDMDEISWDYDLGFVNGDVTLDTEDALLTVVSAGAWPVVKAIEKYGSSVDSRLHKLTNYRDWW